MVKIRQKKKFRPQWDLNQQPRSMAQFVSTYTQTTFAFLEAICLPSKLSITFFACDNIFTGFLLDSLLFFSLILCLSIIFLFAHIYHIGSVYLWKCKLISNLAIIKAVFVPNIVWIFPLWFIYLETHHYTKQLLIFEWGLMTSMSYNSSTEKKMKGYFSNNNKK